MLYPQPTATSNLMPETPLATLSFLIHSKSTRTHTAMDRYRNEILRIEWALLSECMTLNDKLSSVAQGSAGTQTTLAEQDALLIEHAMQVQGRVAELMAVWYRAWNALDNYSSAHKPREIELHRYSSEAAMSY